MRNSNLPVRGVIEVDVGWIHQKDGMEREGNDKIGSYRSSVIPFLNNLFRFFNPKAQYHFSFVCYELLHHWYCPNSLVKMTVFELCKEIRIQCENERFKNCLINKPTLEDCFLSERFIKSYSVTSLQYTISVNYISLWNFNEPVYNYKWIQLSSEASKYLYKKWQ